tara:strand:- start:377 stop:874 length:498 start_codon:yes stop_codon:yes gene_type:complete
MNSCLKASLGKVPPHWNSESKIYGEACEFWISDHYGCPVCCDGKLTKLTANEKSIDHQCASCGELFQVKAHKRSFEKRDGSIGFVGAEYNTTISSLEKEKKWNLILVEYNKELGRIKGVATILKENITKDNIIPRNPLSKNARRAGWQGCNFKFNKSVVNFISKA